MQIYVDESGTFTGAETGSSPSIVGALVIPDHRHDGLMRRYRRLRHSLPTENGEVKGRLLQEDDFIKVVQLLKEAGALFFASMVDVGVHKVADFERHRAGAIEGLTARLTPEHHQNIWDWSRSLQERLAAIPIQLYTQGVILTEVIGTVLNDASLYWVSRKPAELGRYTWTLDAKGSTASPTEWEDWWRQVFMGHLQTRSFRTPMDKIEGGDYSHFAKFEFDTPEFILSHLNDDRGKRSVNLRAVFQDYLTFATKPLPELELSDILTNGLRRAFKGTLQQRGWAPIRALMLHRPTHYITVAQFNDTSGQSDYVRRVAEVLAVFKEGGRSMRRPSGARGS